MGRWEPNNLDGSPTTTYWILTRSGERCYLGGRDPFAGNILSHNLGEQLRRWGLNPGLIPHHQPPSASRDMARQRVRTSLKRERIHPTPILRAPHRHLGGGPTTPSRTNHFRLRDHLRDSRSTNRLVRVHALGQQLWRHNLQQHLDCSSRPRCRSE